jgi:hypothetical protein
LRRLLWLLLVLAVIYVWTGRLLAKVIPQHRAGIEYWLTQQLATPVTIGDIQVSGHLLAPNIVLRDLRLASAKDDNAPLTLKLCWVGIDGVASLWHQQPRLRFLQLQGLTAQIWQTPDDEWRLSGFEVLQNTLHQSAQGHSQSLRVARVQQNLLWLDALIAQRGLVFEDIQLQLQARQLSSPALKFLYGEVDASRSLPSQKLWMQRLAVHKQNQQYQVFSQLTLLKNDPVNLTLTAHIQGQSLLPETWQAQAHVKLDNTDIKPWVSAQLPDAIRLDHLQGQAEAWITLHSGDLQHLRARIALDQARWRYQFHGYRVDHWQGDFDFQYDHRHQWSLNLQPTLWRVADQQWTLPALKIDRQLQQDQSASWDLQSASADVAQLHQLINAVAQYETLGAALVPSVSSLLGVHHAPLLKPQSVTTRLAQLQDLSPAGQVHGFSWQKKSAEQTWQMQLTDLSLKAKGTWPGFSGVQAQLQGTRRAQQVNLQLQLDSPQLVFDWPDVFRHALPNMRVKGQADFSWQPQQWQLQVKALEALNTDLIGFGQAVVTRARGEATLLRVQAQLRHAQVKAASAYLPTKAMAPSLVDWLEKSVKDGNISQADFLYQGRLEKTRQAVAKSMLMRFQVNNVTLDYLPPWPRLEQAQGEVRVHNRDVQVNLQQGSVLGIKVLPSQLVIRDVDRQRRLQLQADAQGDAQTALMVLMQSPLQKSLAGLLEAIKVQGPIKTHLQLDVPLGGEQGGEQPAGSAQKNTLRPLWANVRTQFENAAIDLPLWKLNLQKFNGELTYDTQKGVSIPNWQALFFDQPVTGRTQTKLLAKRQAIISDFHGNMPLKPFNEWLQQPIVSYASGAAPYQAQLVLTPWQHMQGAFLQVESNLKGIKVALPEPLGLEGKQTLNVRYRQQLDPLQPSIDIRYGSLLRFFKQKQATHLVFGDTRGVSMDVATPGLRISGDLPTIDLQQWAAVFPQRKLGQASPTTANAPSWSDSVLSLRALDLSFSNLRWQDVELGSTRLKVTPRQQDWRVAINSQNLDAEADVNFAFIRHWADQGLTSLSRVNADHLLPLRIARLQLPLSTQPDIPKPLSTTLIPPPISAPPNIAPDVFPAMQLNVVQINKQNKTFGSLQARIQPAASGLFFQDFKAQIKQLNMQGRGQWRWQPSISHGVPTSQSTQFIGQLSTDNMLAFLAAWDYPPVIDAKSARLNVELTWPGNPIDMAISRLEGKLDVQMNNGRLLTVDNTTSSVRVAGIMNFETIIRRMQLDFSDLFKKGLAFDEIKGNFVLANTQMHTDNFLLKGPAATFKVSGNADLLNRQLDHRLIVTLPVSRNLVLPAAATGGLPAAATAFLIEQALGDRLDKLTELTFTMQGSWQDPKIEKR